MRHWHASHPDHPAEYPVTPDDKTPLDCGYSDAWSFTELEREPREFDRFEGGGLIEDEDLRAKAEKRAALTALGTDGLIDLVDELRARVEAIETDGGIAARRSK